MSNPYGNQPPGPPWPGQPQQQQQQQGAPWPAPSQQQPQLGYGQPGAPSPYGPPGAPMVQAYGGPMEGPPSVLGVPLEPGERVIYFHKPTYTGDRVGMIIVGVLLLFIVVGIGFLIYGIWMPKWVPRGQVVTTRRVINVDKNGFPMSIPLIDIMDVEAKRQNAGGGGLVGLAVRAIANSIANKQAKFDSSYWARTMWIVVISRMGQFKLPTKEPQTLGPILARLIAAAGNAENWPSVPYLP